MNWAVISTLLVTVSFISIVLWAFRPNSKKHYDRVSRIPLRDDKNKERASEQQE
jgi:cbb3-type cytochrome oxidase subunit 3